MNEPNALNSGVLYVCATPIGNLEDVSLRLLRILKEVDLIAAEDTRITGRLLKKYEIKTPLVSYHKYNERTRTPHILERLEAGAKVALVSDAGTPGISDPGYEIISKAIEIDCRVVPIPGPNAAIAALAVSGLRCDSFLFHGFVPRKRGERLRFYEALKDQAATIVLQESPHRLLASLEDAVEALGNRRAALARELTKLHEEVIRGTISELLETVKSRGGRVKGELVLVIEGKRDDRRSATPSSRSRVGRARVARP